MSWQLFAGQEVIETIFPCLFLARQRSRSVGEKLPQSMPEIALVIVLEGKNTQMYSPMPDIIAQFHIHQEH
jgi:pyruvate carboxylase